MALALFATAASMAAAQPAERDWGRTLREDAQAFHDDIAANHPRPVNVEDPTSPRAMRHSSSAR